MALLVPDQATDVIRSLLLMYRDGGDLPRWPLCNVYTGCMVCDSAPVCRSPCDFTAVVATIISSFQRAVLLAPTDIMQIGSHADVMIADAVSKNLTDFDVHTAFEAMYLQVTIYP